MHHKVKNKNNFSLLFIIFLTSFTLGILFSLYIGNKINSPVLKNVNSTTIKWVLYNEKDLDLTKFWEIYKTIKTESYDSNIKKQDLEDSAIKGLVNGLSDKHSQYFDTKDTKSFQEALSWDFEGIGAIVEENVLWVKLERIIKGSPAKKYDLRANDIVLKANGQELRNLPLMEAVSYIKGPAGTSVDLEIFRVWYEGILHKKVIRQKINIPSVHHETLENNIWYISLNQFWDNTVEEFKKSLKELENTDGLILDLRDNGGWYLQSAVFILSEFIEKDKTLVVTKYKEFYKNYVYKSINEDGIYDKKIVVLINENSASASEIMAGALSDHNKAILVWEKSYGKWSVQKPFDFPDGSMVKLTIAKWFTPDDKNIDKEWISPDIQVGFLEEDYKNKYDRQKQEAIKILEKFKQIGSINLTVDSFNDKK